MSSEWHVRDTHGIRYPWRILRIILCVAHLRPINMTLKNILVFAFYSDFQLFSFFLFQSPSRTENAEASRVYVLRREWKISFHI
jgi:hypothetical protein